MHFLDDLYFTREYLKAGVLVSLLSVWVLVALFYYLNRYTKRRYFTIWTAAWLFYALWITWSFGFRGDAVQPLVLMLQQWCVGVSAVFLLWGSLDFMGQPVRSSMLGWFMLFLLLWSYLGAYYLSRPLELEVPVFTLIAFGSWHTSLGFLKYRSRRPYIGATLLTVGFFLWGAYMAGYPFLENSEDLTSLALFISAGLQLLLAVSMIILVLEEFRETHQLALAETQTIKVERNALESRVHSTEERYRTLFDQAGEAIVITSSDDFHILELNQAAERLLALTRGEAGRHTLKAFCQSWDSAAVTAQTPSDWVASLVRQQPSNLVRKDGGTVPVEIRGSVVDLDGQPAYQFFISEVTERRQLEQQLRQSEKLSALGQMISGIAHELNNPLAVIKGYVQLILAHHELQAQTRKDLEKVGQESNRAAKLVANFLSFARNQPAHRELLDLNKMVERLAELRRFDLMAGKTAIELKLEPTLPAILADPDQVQEVIVNLTNNALQAMAGNGRPPRLRFSTRTVGKNVQLMVEDSGPGVPEELRVKIFEPFFTTKEVGTGTGLGLSLAHSLMTEHGGRIFYRESELGGAGFVVEFPAAEGRPAATGDTTTMLVRPTAPLSPGQGSRVLVLDDEKGIADMLSEMLGILGYETRVCNAAADALEWIDKERFDAVISDFRMPGINGEQFYGLARDRKPELAPRIIFLTGDVVNEETQRFLQSTGNPHLAKPFDLAKVQKIVAETIRVGAAASGTELKARDGQNGG
jgi:PAS domain S-box-containing protein